MPRTSSRPNMQKLCEVIFLIFQSLTYVDLNARTLDGKLPEEMTEDKNIIRLVKKARTAEPSR